jgi:hypothetical protein
VQPSRLPWPPAQLLQVERRQLLHQGVALVGAEPVPPGEDVFLAVVPQALPKVGGRTRHGTLSGKIIHEGHEGPRRKISR